MRSEAAKLFSTFSLPRERKPSDTPVTAVPYESYIGFRLSDLRAIPITENIVLQNFWLHNVAKCGICNSNVYLSSVCLSVTFMSHA